MMYLTEDIEYESIMAEMAMLNDLLDYYTKEIIMEEVIDGIYFEEDVPSTTTTVQPNPTTTISSDNNDHSKADPGLLKKVQLFAKKVWNVITRFVQKLLGIFKNKKLEAKVKAADIAGDKLDEYLENASEEEREEFLKKVKTAFEQHNDGQSTSSVESGHSTPEINTEAYVLEAVDTYGMMTPYQRAWYNEALQQLKGRNHWYTLKKSSIYPSSYEKAVNTIIKTIDGYSNIINSQNGNVVDIGAIVKSARAARVKVVAAKKHFENVLWLSRKQASPGISLTKLYLPGDLQGLYKPDDFDAHYRKVMVVMNHLADAIINCKMRLDRSKIKIDGYLDQINYSLNSGATVSDKSTFRTRKQIETLQTWYLANSDVLKYAGTVVIDTHRVLMEELNTLLIATNCAIGDYATYEKTRMVQQQAYDDMQAKKKKEEEKKKKEEEKKKKEQKNQQSKKNNNNNNNQNNNNNNNNNNQRGRGHGRGRNNNRQNQGGNN